MRKISKLSATALAMALSITLIAPLSANAQVIRTWENDDKGFQKDTTYTNEDTKKSLSEKDGFYTARRKYNPLTDETIDGIRFALESELKTKTIATKSYNETELFVTSADTAKLENFKSNKKGLKVKVISKYEYTDTDPSEIKAPCYDYEDKERNAYYKNINGEIIKDGSEDHKSCPKGADFGSYIVRFYAKKAGTYKVSYDAKLKDGTTVKKKFKVIAKEDGAAIKSVTFGGQLLDVTADTDSFDKSDRVWAKGYGINTTSKKSGKIRVTMNKDFKLKKIEIGTPSIQKTEDIDSKIVGYTPANSEVDMIDGEITCTWKKVKNGKKIKLSKVDEAEVGVYSKDTTFSKKSTATITYIRITYYDKKNKETKRAYLTIEKTQK